MPKSELTRRIYALAAVSDMIEQGSHEDDLHFLVYRETGKTSVRELTDKEAEQVIKELKEVLRLSELEKRAPPASSAALMSENQKRFCFRLMHKLSEIDIERSEATLRERLSGVICKITGVPVSSTGDIFKGLTEAEGAAVIEELKRYIKTAKRRRQKKSEPD